jgi:pilus assembly protein TadC
MSQYSEHYKQLHDEALVELALRGELVPEAEVALREELRSRGISDLSSEFESRKVEAEAEERHRHQQLALRTKVLKWRTRFLYAMAVVVFIWGLVLYLNHDPLKSTEDGGLLLLGALLLALFAFVSHKATKAWHERVLFRRPPT